jgi:hypothetical protein
MTAGVTRGAELTAKAAALLLWLYEQSVPSPPTGARRFAETRVGG